MGGKGAAGHSRASGTGPAAGKYRLASRMRLSWQQQLAQLAATWQAVAGRHVSGGSDDASDTSAGSLPTLYAGRQEGRSKGVGAEVRMAALTLLLLGG